MYVRTYVRLLFCVYNVCMYVYVYVVYECMYIYIYVCMYEPMYVCMYV